MESRINCGICGVEVAAKTWNHKYCSGCKRRYKTLWARQHRVPKPPRFSNCVKCGKGFRAYGNQKYCNNPCNHRLQFRPRKLPAPKDCEYCGIMFVRYEAHQLYCSFCGGFVKREIARLRSLRETRVNNEKSRMRKRKWRLNNQPKQRLAILRWKENNPKKHAAQVWRDYRKREARMVNITEVFTQEQWLAKRRATNGICPGCNVHVGLMKLQLDHIFPVSKAEKGTIYTIDDVQPLCISCNSRKWNRVGEEFGNTSNNQ